MYNTVKYIYLIRTLYPLSSQLQVAMYWKIHVPIHAINWFPGHTNYRSNLTPVNRY